MLKKRIKEAYDRVFSTNDAFQDDIDMVLHDILSKTFVNKPINGNKIERAEREGMRKIGLHIHNMLKLDIDYFIKLDELSGKRNKAAKESLI